MKKKIICFLSLSTCLCLFSCVGHRLCFKDKGFSLGEEMLSVAIKGGKRGQSNKTNSLDVTLNYVILKNDIPYTFIPDNFVVNIVYPKDAKQVAPVISKCTGALRYLRTEPFTLEGKKSVEAKFKIETENSFNLDSLDIRVVPAGFVLRENTSVFPDTLIINSQRWAYK